MLPLIPSPLRACLCACLLGALFPAHDASADTYFLKDGTALEGAGEADGDQTVITGPDGKKTRVKTAEVMAIRRAPSRQTPPTPTPEAGEMLIGATKTESKAVPESKASDPSPAKNANLDDEARALSKRLETLFPPTKQSAVPALAPPAGPAALATPVAFPDHPEFHKLLEEARTRPDVFALVLRVPGKTRSANQRDGLLRARVAWLMGQAADRRALAPLLDACFEDSDERVRSMAAQALQALGEPMALRKLCDAAVDGRLNWPTRMLACQAIMRYGGAEGVERLLAETSFELASGNALDPKNKLRAAPKGGLGSDDPLNMQGGNTAPSGPVDETSVYPALSALKYVTGQTLERHDKNFKSWREWWEKDKAGFKFPEIK